MRFMKSLVVLMFLSSPIGALAGVLDSFERDATSGPPDSYEPAPVDSGDDCGLFQSCYPATPEAATESRPAFPREDRYRRLEFDYHSAGPNVSAYELQFTRANGKFGVYAKLSRYGEHNPTDQLDLGSIYLLYRPPAGNHVEADVGLGVATLAGNKVTTGFAVTVPIRFEISERLSLETNIGIISLQGNSIEDMRIVMAYRDGGVEYTAGYKFLNATTMSLQGPVAGIALRW